MAEASLPPTDSPKGAFHRQLGVAALVAYGLAYIAPVAPLSTLGLVWQASNGLMALSYLLGGVCMGFTALSYALMVREVTSAGSVYGFARSVLGPFWGFVAGWQILLDYLLIPAFVYVVMAVALSQIMPGVDRAVWIVALAVFTSSVNWFGMRSTTSVSFVSVAAQVVVMIALVAVAAIAQARLHGVASALGTAPLWRNPLPLHGVLAGTSICVMSFLGFDAVSTLAEDTADRSGRTLGRAILAVLGLATLFFVVLTWVLGNAMVGRQFHSLDAASFELAGQLAGPWAMLGLAWFYAIVVGFTNALPMQVGVARVLYAMGRDRQLPQALARLHPRHNTPHVAMLASTAVSLAVALVMRQQVEQLAAFVNFGALAGFTLLHVCVLVHFARHPDRRRVLLHVISPVLGIVVVGAVLAGMNGHALELGMVWFVAGLALWLLRVRHTGAAITTAPKG
ncbi:APC family permease [Novosphingobium sp. FKTRR1]|uniref:APC family permease n=1 Tax=unclassified Novosphingobium TaxID=2644732 RepID=UPI001CF0C890|nr:APC family permease [Novosphingobium sp. FKTRR1]